MPELPDIVVYLECLQRRVQGQRLERWYDAIAARIRPDRPTLVVTTLEWEADVRRTFGQRWIDKAQAGENFISQHIFDGATAESAVLVSAVIGPKVEPDAEAAKQSALLNRPGWRVRLAFFPADPKAEKPDYELGMLLLDNGVSRDMVIDYGEYSIRAKLDDIEALPKPGC